MPVTKYRIPIWRTVVLKALRVEVRKVTPVDLFAGGPVILTCNHQSFLDGIILAFAAPVKMVFPVSNVQSVENRYTRLGLLALQGLGLGTMVPMNSDHPFGMRQLLSSLKSGQSVAVFPQGRIAWPDEDLPEKAGVEWLHRRTGATVVRAKLRGADDSRFFGRAGRKIWPRIVLEL